MSSGKTMSSSIFCIVTRILISFALLTGAEHNCSQTFREAFGEIQFSPSNYYHLQCHLSITSGMPDAIAVLSVQEINLRYCSDYVKITDGNGTDVLYHNGCNEQFAPEILFDVHFGLSNNISIRVSASSSSSSIKIEYAILMQSLTSAVIVSGWNISVSNPDSSGATFQWTSLDANVNHQANFYIIEVKSMDGIPLDVHTVPGNTTTSVIKRLEPSTKYRVVVYGVDNNGQPYMSSQGIFTTSKVLCGARPSSTRIVGGTVAAINSWPWQVMLMEHGRQFCGGSLVYPYCVITAAHCVQRKSVPNLKIRVGAHYRTSGSVGTEQDITVSKIIVHENYQIPKTYSNDIALLYLEKPVVLGIGVGLVCLPDIKNILPVDLNETCWITGWGDLYSGGYQPNTLMQASVPLVSKQRCSNVYPGKIDDSMLCAGLDQGGIDTCQGDSGGPLVCEFNGTWHLEGITSWGYGCAQAYKYGVYAKVRALDSWVQANIYKVVPPNTIQPHNQSSVSLISCSFDNGLCSGWRQLSSDDFDWTLGSGSTPSSSTGPSFGQGGSGKYMYIEASSPRKPGEKAQIVVTVPNKGKKACLSFYYHMYGASAGSLNVYSGNDTVFNVSGNQGNRWVIVEKSLHLDSEITFEGVRGGSYTGDIAIDQVLITEGNCPVSCGFDNGLCLWWSQSKSDVFDWRLGSGSTPSSGTGPSSDRSGTGMYMYTEASYQSTGDNAKLELSVPSGKSSSCLTFYYHMYGSSMGTLNVFNGNDKIFAKSGNQGSNWKKVTKTLHLNDVLTFEGIRGTSFTSDIAIDDVQISNGNCPGCGGILNKSSGVVHLANSGNEDETHCIWTIGNAGLRQSYALLSLQRVYLGYCSEHVKVFHEDGTALFDQEGCQSSLPYGTSLEIPFGFSNHIAVDISLQYRWSAVSIQYIISKQGHYSAKPISSWNATVDTITSSSATVRWSNFPLSSSINHYLVRFKEVSGVSILFQVSGYSNSYYTKRLKGYTSYDVTVLAVTASDGNITYSSKNVSMKTAEGVPRRAPSNAYAVNHGLNEFLVEWDPLPHQYANGRLLGYKVYYKDADYYYSAETSVNTSNADESQVALGGVQPGRRYKISVVAFTSKGEGPRSPDLYVTKGCEGSINQVSGWLYFSNSRYNTLNCRVQLQNAGVQSGSALISFQSTYFRYCSEYIKIFDRNGAQVFHRGGCDSLTNGMSVEVPFGDGHSNITLAFLFSYRYSYVRVQYSILNQPLSSAQLVPSWNISISNTTTTSMTVQWSNFPLINHSIQQLLVSCREHDSNVSLIFQTPSSYNAHYTGRVLRSYQYYEVQVIAVASNSSNGTFISRKEIGRTDEGVPSTAPSNVRLTNLQSHEVKVQWDPIPPETANGILLGYRVFYQEYYYSGLLRSVDTKSPSVHMLILRGLKSAQRYQISVAALTSKGAGPRSYLRYFTTGCGGQLKESFGQVLIGSNRNYYYLSCTWNIVNVGIQQAVAFIWIKDFYFSYSSGYLKILDGNGSVLLHQHKYSAIQEKIFLEVEFGSADNITIQTYLRSAYSHFQLYYGTLKRGLQTALLTSNWNVTVENVTSTSVSVLWTNLELLIGDQVLHYISLITSANGSTVLNAVITSGNTTTGNISGLSVYTEYQMSIFGVGSDGQAYKSSNVTFWTEEGVPSGSPSNVRLSNLQHNEIQVQWEPLAQHYVNGRLQGYRVRVYENGYYYYYYYGSPVQTLETPGPYVHTMKVGGLKAAQQYRVTVAAFTSKGEGPQSYWRYITTGCGGSVNQSFGEIQVGRRGYYSSYLRCNWEIGNPGFNQSILIVSFEELYLSSYNEYVKIIDGNGVTVFHHSAYSSSALRTFLLVPYGSGNNVKVQIYFYNSWSQFKLQYGIVNQDLQSAVFVSNWNVTIGNTTQSSIGAQWQNLNEMLNQQILHLVGLVQISSGTTMNAKIMPGNTTFVVFDGLSSYRQYSIAIVGVDDNGKAYKSANITAWTDEGVPSRAPSGVRVTTVEYTTDLLVKWNSLSQIYANGKILGYTIYYREYNNWYSPYKTINTSRPYPTQFVLKGLKPAERYRVAVAAFTSKGRGPMSYYTYGTTSCSQTLREAFGKIQYSPNNYYYLRCHLSITSGGMPDAIAVLSVQEINLRYCSDYVKITDGNGTDVLYHNGCNGKFAPEILFDVQFGLSNNISIQVSASSSSRSIKIEYAVLMQSLTSSFVVSRWNVSVSNPDSSGATLQWTSLDSNVNHQANFYIIEVKSMDGAPLDVHTVPGNTTTSVIKQLKPSTKYRVVVYGVDNNGQPYMSSQSILTTSKVFCGARPSSTRIVGGTDATVNSWPWQVMVTEYGRQFCGGSLVHLYWVITAAHCVQRKSATDIKIRVGAHYRTSASVGTEQDIAVSKIIVHENYQTPKTYSNDIALLYLEKPAVPGVGVGLVCLPDIKNILPVDLNETCWITGWGTLYSGGYQPNTLMQASVPLVSKQRCSNVYSGKIDDSMLCAGLDQGGIDTCQGDSGGPLVCEFNDTWYLEGITSWGYGCAQAYKYGVYAKVRALDSWVQANIYKVVPPNTIQSQNQSSVSLLWCSFDNGLCSGWSQSSSDDFDWTLGSGSTPSSSTGPSSGQGGSGNYLYIEASSPRKPGEKAHMVITVPNKGKKACLSFYYHMYGASAGTLNVYNGNDTVFNMSGNQGNRWVIVEKSLHLDSEITFEGVRGGSYTSDIAIDQVLITEGNCPVSCSFDSGLCLWWSQSKSDSFDWRLGSGSTSSSGTGPSSDRSGTGMYMYTEASYQSRGDNAKLELSVPSGRSSSCLIFYYHMYGSTMGTLNVFNGNEKIFTKSGNQGFYWKKVTKALHLRDVLTFEGIIGTSVTSDIAIDDVKISDGNCPGCGGVLNKSSGVVHLANTGNEDETHCFWTIGNTGLRQSYASLSLQSVSLGYCSEYVKVFHEDGTELFNQGGCQSSLPYGTLLEIPFGVSNHITVDISLQYRWSAVNIQYIISKQRDNSAQPISSWNTTVDTITSSSATVRWSNFPLSSSINHYLVRFKEVSGVSTLFQVSSYSNSYYTNRLKGYTSYDVEVLAVTASDGNITYSSKTVSMKTAEGVPSRAPSNVRTASHGFNEFLVEWDPLPHQYTNGRLLGYKVYYKDADYYYWSEKSVNTSNADKSQVVLGGVQSGRRYKISVVAFTSKGEGPRSPDLYVTKGCEGFVNQVSGSLYFSNSRYGTLNCSVQVQNAGIQHGSALISFQSIYFGYCSEYIKIFDSNGVQVFHRGGCDSLTSGMSVEVPLGDRHSITLAFLFSYRYSYARVQYSIQNQPFSSAQLVPSWNISISNTATKSMTVQWSNFPLTSHSIQQLLVNYREHNSNVSLIFQTRSYYNTHYTGRVLRSYQYYDVQVIAVGSNSSNGTFISRKEIGRTDEGVPSTAPMNVRLTNLQSHEVKVQWDPIPPETANGVLLGYRVFYQEYYYSGLLQSVDTKSPDVHMLVLRGLKSAQRYQISVAAFTSKGAGSRSYLRYITTGCGGQLNQSFGQVHVGSNRNYYYLSCTWNIVNVGMQQAVAFIWISDSYFSYSSGYLKILDGNGSVVLHQHRYSAIQEKIFLKVEFGNANNVTIQAYLASRYSHFQLSYGTLKQGLQSAWLTANWNVTVENVTSTSVSVFWNNLELLTDEQVLHYISLIRSVNGSSVLNAVFTSGNTTSGNISGLSAYTEYQISIVGVESNGQAHNSSKLTFWTEEGVPSRSPSNVRLSNLQHHEIQVRWEPLAQHYVNGRLQGYRVRVYEYGYYYYSFLVQTLETPGPYVHTMKIGGLKAAQQYRVTVAAFTSKGEGPQSYRRYITTGCGGSVNQSFGEIQVGRRGYYSSYLRCNWEIGNSGFNQSILIVSFEDLYISRYSDYVKIIDGSGATVFHHTGYSSSPLKTFLLVQYGRGNSVKVQIYFYNGWSQFKLQYGIINQDLYSALFVSNWNVTIGNTTEKSISVQWQNLKELLNQQILHLFGLLQTSNGTTLKAKIMPADKKFVVFDGLSSYRQYSVVIFGVDNSGKVYKSANITAWTDEGVPSRGPLNITFTNVESTEITVQWDPLQQQYINGRLLGYRVYFQLSAHYYYFALRNNNETVNTTTVTLKGLDPGQRYHISVSAFTSKGEGPRSYYHYVKTACKITLNQSAGLIDVTHTDYNNLHCNWTIGNFGKTNAVALFLFKRLAFVTCSEHVKIFSGSGTLEYYKAGCCPRTQGSLVEIPFMKFDNIAVNILLTQLKSRIASHFVILKHGLHSATYTSGWLASVDSITSSSFQIQWNNLTSLINQEILHYIILLSRTNGSAPYHVLVDGGRLDMEIDGLEHSQMYSMKVYGVDALGYCYKTLEANAATKNASCGSRPSGTRIVGGSIAIVNSWPWQAMLRTSYGSQFCGGTLIHPQWVLTATHCVWRRSASSVKVVLGTHYRSYGNVGTEQSFDVVKIIEHERYNSPNSFSNDIALLQLSKPAKLGKGVGLVCLPDTSFQLPFDNPNKTCWITGWGRLSYLGISPNELMQVDIPLVSKQRCSTSYPGKIDDSMICVGQDQGGIGGCHGDSGGPLVCEFNGKWYLEGATSWGGLPCADPLKYTVYANIRHLKSWITSKMYSLPDPGPTVFNRSCSFDTSLCSGWEQSVSDDFDWTRKRGSTGSWATGPSSDHTSGSGYYMYIEASYPRVMGDKAKLDLSLCGNGDVACLTFYYHMYGSSMGTLNVFSGNTVVFSASGNKGNYWQKAERSIYLDKVLTFEGIVGNSSSGDIAIDDVSISGGNCPGQTLPPRWSPVPTTLKPSTPDDCSDDPEHASICSTVFTYSEICQNNRDWTMKHCQKTCGYCRGISTSTHVMTFKPTTIPPTPSAKEMQEAVMLKMTNFDMNKWKEMEADFKQEVASAATRYCAGGGASCQISLRRRRSSDSMEFSGDMVHIVLGYPKQSPDDPSITLLAFYLQLPGDIGDSLVSEDVLKNIVKNHMKSIEGSMGVSITTVESMSSAQLQNENDEEDKKEDIDNEQSTSNFVIVGVTLGALLLLGIIIAVTWCIKTTRFGPKCRVHPNKKIDEGIDEGREAVYENTKKQEVTFSKPSGIAYDNSAYVSVKQTIAVAQQNEFIPIGDLRDKLYGQQTSKNVRSSAEETSLDEGYREERLSRCSDEMSPVETVNC